MLDLYESSAQQSFTSINSVIIRVLARLGLIARDCHVRHDLSHSREDRCLAATIRDFIFGSLVYGRGISSRKYKNDFGLGHF